MSSNPVAVEALEPRTLFSAPHEFAGVGVRFDNGPRLFLVGGTVGADDSISGTMQFADATGALGTDPIDWTSLIRGDAGAMTFGTRDSFTPYASQVGTQFIVEDRWLRGSFVGRDGDGNTRDFAALAELEDLPSTIFGTEINLTRITSGGTLENLTLLIGLTPETEPGTSYRFTYQLPSGDVVVDRTATLGTFGRIHFETGEVLIVPHRSHGGSAVYFADFDDSDDIVGIGIGRIGSEFISGDSGRYRSAVLVSGPIGASFFGVDPGDITPGLPTAANVLIELNLWNPDIGGDASAPHSTFRVFRQSEWDAGMRTPITRGTWSYLSGGIRLRSDAGDEVTVGHSFPRTLVFIDASDGTDTEDLQGQGAAIVYRAGAVEEMIVETDAAGRPMAYLQFFSNDGENTETLLLSVDLLDEVGGEAVVGPIFTWSTGPHSQDRYVAGLSASGDVQLWRLLDDGVSWSYTNLTDAIPGARPIASELFNTGSLTTEIVFPAGQVTDSHIFQTLAGYDADGNFVAYKWSGGQGVPASSYWRFLDIEVDGVDGEGVVPDVVGGLSGWNADWGASHFAGVDSAGELWSIWWAPGMERWRVDSLTDSAGGPVLAAARPAAVSTTWNAFHISAVDTQGHLVVTWWAPGFENWRTEDMTAELGGPTLTPGSLTADFSRSLANLNIVGSDQDGRARIYWWNVNTDWNIGDLTAGISPGDFPADRWQTTHSRWIDRIGSGFADSQSLLARNDDGDLVRLIWRSQEQDAWVLENVTAMSTPYVV